MAKPDPLRILVEKFLLDGDARPILEHVRLHPQSREVCQHTYPYLHRIMDLDLSGTCYRVGRCISCDERIFVFPLSSVGDYSKEGGVPLYLTGDSLRRAIEWMVRDGKTEAEWKQFLEEPAGPTAEEVMKGAQREEQAKEVLRYIFGPSALDEPQTPNEESKS